MILYVHSNKITSKQLNKTRILLMRCKILDTKLEKCIIQPIFPIQ